MKRISTYLLFLITFTINGFALSCDSLSEFKQYGGKWYALSSSKITWDVAKAIAENNGGYLAIPKNASENQFLKNAFNGGWLGVYDPTFSSNYCSEYDPNCIANINNYKTVLGEVLTYHNFATGEPSNTIYDTDIIDGNQLVSPLGEHWVAMGQNGQWGDFGNHARENNNPIRMRAIFEFTSKPECAPESGVNETDYTTKKCQTQVYDITSGVLGHGQLFDCQQDQYGTDYCPSQMAPCGQEWDYDDGFSILHTASITEYANTTTINHTIEADTKNVFVRNLTATECCQYRFGNEVIAGRYVWDDWGEAVFCTHTTQNIRDRYNERNWNRWCAGTPSNPRECYHHGPEYTRACFNNKQCPVGYRNASGGDTSCIKTISQCPEGYTPVYGSINGVYRGVHVQDTWITACNKNEYLCPDTSWTKVNNSTCKRVKTYTYYDYLCDPKTNIYEQLYTPQNLGGDCLGKNLLPDGSCNSSTPPKNNCHRKTFTCKEAPDRPCALVDNKWQCSPFPCFGDEDYEDLDTKVGATDSIDKGFSDDGNCYGQIRLFNGKDMRCRSMDWSLLGKNCCSRWKIGGIAGLLGASCKEDEIALAKYRQEQKDKSHEVGEYCSKKLRLGFTKICIQKKRTYCVFNSKLARIIHQGGRPQLGIGWGSPQSPNCKGFTPEQFQKLDFSKIDMGEFYSDVQQSISKKIDAKIGTTIQQKVEGFGSNLGGGS